ncbi:MAG: 3-oxoacyl-[acyl-carrier-protein] reductase [Bacteroidota bacterium]
MRLENKIAVITGGARGIGAATARIFCEAGAKVVIWDLLDEVGTQTAKTLRAAGHDAIFMSVNTTDASTVQQATDTVMQQHGRIDILVNNAGITRDASFLKMSHDQWQQVLDVNLSGVFNCTKAIAPIMKENKWGRIISTSSIVGIHGNFGQTNYVATKAGVIGMTKVWAQELGKYGITANAVAPGFIQTEMTDAIPEEYRQKMIQTIPVKRAGQPEDIANAYLYLASEEASFVNGHTISVNGGAG